MIDDAGVGKTVRLARINDRRWLCGICFDVCLLFLWLVVPCVNSLSFRAHTRFSGCATVVTKACRSYLFYLYFVNEDLGVY